MLKNDFSLSNAVKFHGHLGPYLVLGLLAGRLGLKIIKSKRHFGIAVCVAGANKKPKSCLIDGLQLSTGATYGKGNIKKIRGNNIKIVIVSLESKKTAIINLRMNIIKKLRKLKGHADSELFALKLYKTNPLKIFKLTRRF